MSWNPDPRFSPGAVPPAPEAGPRPSVPEFLILTALASEAEILCGAGRVEYGLIAPPGEVRRRTLGSGRDVWVGYTGLGRSAAEAALAAFATVRPTKVVFAGVGGALRGDLAPGDLVVLDSAVREGGTLVDVSPDLTRALGAAFDRVGLATRRRGTSVEVPRIAGTPEDKRALARRFPDACVIAMEDVAAIAGARALGAEVAAFRVVVDRLGDHVPDLSPALDGAGRARPFRLAAHLVNHPAALRRLPGLARSFATARRTLDCALAAVLDLAAGRPPG